jgi:hypothetical protein
LRDFILNKRKQYLNFNNMNKLSDRINKLATSQTLAMAALARELKAQGKDIISLSLGEPDFNTPEFIKEAAIQAIHDNTVLIVLLTVMAI